MNKTVVMVGMMGAGKTAIGTAVARELDVAFLDSDSEIIAAANMSIAEIFARDGEDFFREKEAQVISRLMTEERCILSTGGGAYLRPENRDLISKKGLAVWLRADVDLLWTRVRHKDTRPLLRTENPYATLQEIQTARAPVYALAEIAVDAQPEYTISDMTARVIEALLERPDVLVREG